MLFQVTVEPTFENFYTRRHGKGARGCGCAGGNSYKSNRYRIDCVIWLWCLLLRISTLDAMEKVHVVAVAQVGVLKIQLVKDFSLLNDCRADF